MDDIPRIIRCNQPIKFNKINTMLHKKKGSLFLRAFFINWVVSYTIYDLLPLANEKHHHFCQHSTNIQIL